MEFDIEPPQHTDNTEPHIYNGFCVAVRFKWEPELKDHQPKELPLPEPKDHVQISSMESPPRLSLPKEDEKVSEKISEKVLEKEVVYHIYFFADHRKPTYEEVMETLQADHTDYKTYGGTNVFCYLTGLKVEGTL